MSPPPPTELTDDPLARLRVVLVRTSHPGNIGGVARAMHTMGLADLVLVAPRRFPDPEATAMAAGADALLERVRVVATLAEAVSSTTSPGKTLRSSPASTTGKGKSASPGHPARPTVNSSIPPGRTGRLWQTIGSGAHLCH